MKCFFKVTAFLFFLFVPFVSFAGWQVAHPQSTHPSDPFFQVNSYKKTSFTQVSHVSHVSHVSDYKTFVHKPVFPAHYYSVSTHSNALYAISISGSLKQNIERIMRRYHWRVIWHSPYDYNFEGRVTGVDLPDVMRKLFQPFPLQAQMYLSNRVMIVVPREL